MADFYETGLITTLHKYNTVSPEQLEDTIKRYVSRNPVALVLPCLFSELQEPALPKIIEELKKVDYLTQVVVALDGTSREGFEYAKRFFSKLPQKCKIIWGESPTVQELYELLKDNNIDIGLPGKGRSVWIALGYVIADAKAGVIALHDCDIINYNREMLARLCYPVVVPTMGYEFAKGYYARISDRLYGRVTRLFVIPINRSLEKIIGYHPFITYLDSFRYPLSGEIALSVDLARIVRIPSDWGLEIGLLAEVYKNLSLRRICDVEIADFYDHKHQSLGPGDASKGLMKMVVDIAKSLFRTLGQEGVNLSESLFRTLKITYIRTAQDAVKKYADLSMMNNLSYDRHAEEEAVDAFARGIDIASKQVLEDPFGTPPIPNWNRVISAIPEFFNMLKSAVDEINR